MRPKKQRRSSNTGTWMNTYADMVTLLLAFFVLMFAFSSVDQGRFDAAISSIQRSLGVLDGGLTITSSEPLIIDQAELGLRQLQELYHDLSEYIEEQNLVGVHLEYDERGVTIRFADQVFFDLGQASLKPEALDILENMAPNLRELPNPIRVEGHTDNLPIRNANFASNWELSVHRATNVVRFLIEEQDFSPENLSVAGYSEYRPVLPNDSDANRAINRRVDIVIMHIDLWDEEPN